MSRPSSRFARAGGVTPRRTPIRAAARRPYATASPCEQPAVPGRGLERMPERMPQVERHAPAVFALVRADHLDLRPGRPLDDLGQRAARDGFRVARRDGVTVVLEQREQALVAEDRHLRGLGKCGPPFALGERGEERDVGDDLERLVERPDEVLALGQVDRRLAPDRGVDLGDERRRDMDQRHAAQVDGRDEPGGIAERTAADGDEGLPPLDAKPGQPARDRLDDRQRLRRLAGRAVRRARARSPPRSARARAPGRRPARRPAP